MGRISSNPILTAQWGPYYQWAALLHHERLGRQRMFDAVGRSEVQYVDQRLWDIASVA